MPQRLRITFARGEGIRYLSHLELMRLWERVLRRAEWKLAYSHGYNPHPRISFAAALPVGVASEAELLEIHLEEGRSTEEAMVELSRQMPPGIEVRKVEEVPAEAPPMQRELVAAEYLVQCPMEVSREKVRLSVERAVAAASLPRQRQKEGEVRSYDLRPMIRSLSVSGEAEGQVALRMELRNDAQGAGRPDEVLLELGIEPADCRITRLRLLLREAE